MAQYYNFVTNASGTLTLEEVQRICSVEGQSVQLVVEDINNDGNGSQQVLAYTSAPQNSEQPISSQQTINLGSQISTTQLEQGRNVFIIKTNEASATQEIIKSTCTINESIVNIVDNRGPKVECNNEGQQIQWIKMQENSINVDAVSKQNTLLPDKSQTATVTRNQLQNTIPSSSPLHGHSESPSYTSGQTERKPLRLYQNKGRVVANNIQTGLPSIASDGVNVTDSAETRVQNSNVSNNRTSTPSFRGKTANSVGQNVTPTPIRPIRAPHLDAFHTRAAVPLQMSKNLLRLQHPEMEHLSERIKQAKLKQMQNQRQMHNDQRLQQSNAQRQQLSIAQQSTQATVNTPVQRRVSTNSMQQKQYSIHLQQMQKQPATTQEQKIHCQQQQQPQQQQQQQTSPLSPSPHTAHNVMEVDSSEYSSPEKAQQRSPLQDSENATESIAYLQETIYNPKNTIVQHQIQGNTAKMLVMLPNNIQRLVTYNIPNGDCTVQDLLDQVNITFCSETVVSLVSEPHLGINYIVEGPGTLTTLHDISDHSDGNTSQENTTANFDNSSHNISSPDENSNPSATQNETYCKRNNERGSSTKLEKLERDGPICKRGRGRGRSIAVVRSRPINKEPECLTISSDEEEEGKKKSDSMNCSSLLSHGNNTSSDDMETILEKEPVITNNSVSSTNADYTADGEEDGGRECEGQNFADNVQSPHTAILCRTVRIGSYKYVPRERVVISQSGVRFGVPLLEDDKNFVTLDVKLKDIVRVLIHFGKSMPVLFFYTCVETGAMIRELLGMQDPKGPYYDPAGKDHTHKRITLLPERLTEESKMVLKNLFLPRNLLAELNPKEANDILVRASPKDSLQVQSLSRRLSQASSSNTSVNGGIQTITVYPPPPAKGGIAINTEDYLCLGEDQFLNDVIIDFYLKYLTLEVLSESDQQRTHVFSSYFYKRLTSPHTQATESTIPLSPAAKRHARVQKWTKNVNIFEKDLIVIPINEHAHWFLAIICFPGLVGKVLPNSTNVKEDDIHKTVQKSKKLKEMKLQTVTIGSTTITPVKTTTITIDQADDGSERDEAEGDDDEMEMDSDDDDETETQEGKSLQNKPDHGVLQQKEVTKIPCILIFDSLAGASRSRVVATLRDYLSCEHVAKMGTEKTFSKETIKGACPKVPQQSNFTDCGLYVLQYVESFFKDPIKDYTLPIKTLKNWFEEIVVTRKREELSKILINLMNRTKGDRNISLPVVNFPTQDGKLKPKSENHVDIKTVKSEAESKKKSTLDGENRISNNIPAALENTEPTTELVNRTTYQIIPYSPCTSSNSTDSNTTEMLTEPKTHIRSSSETMSYLKAKRIPRLMLRTENQDDSQAAKKHKGESFDSCK